MATVGVKGLILTDNVRDCAVPIATVSCVLAALSPANEDGIDDSMK